MNFETFLDLSEQLIGGRPTRTIEYWWNKLTPEKRKEEINDLQQALLKKQQTN